jgi:hypothetical protein
MTKVKGDKIKGSHFDCLLVKPINDDRLTATMERTRSGSQYFREKDFPSRGFMTNEPETCVIIKNLKPEYYSELVDGVWWWVNNCAECCGNGRDWMSSECEKHDRCSVCSINGKDLEKGVSRWGGKHGWTCDKCKNAIYEADKAEALENFDEESFDEWHYYREDEAKCPYCDAKNVFEYDGDDSPEPIDCYTCGNEFSIELDFEIKYTTKRIKPKT